MLVNSPYWGDLLTSQAPLMGYSKPHHFCPLFGAAGINDAVRGIFAQLQDRKSNFSFRLLTVAFGRLRNGHYVLGMKSSAAVPSRMVAATKPQRWPTTEQKRRECQGCSGGCLNVMALKLHTQACMPCFINKRTVFISKCLISGQ